MNYALACKKENDVCYTDEQCMPLQYKKDRGKNKIILFSWLFGTLYAVTDEIHQLFIQGRSCEFRDVCIDSLGVLTGIIVALTISKIYVNIKNKLSKERTSKN